MNSRFETGEQDNSSESDIWSKIREILLLGTIVYVTLFFVNIGTKYVRQETFSVLEEAVSSTVIFIIVIYYKTIELENCQEEISQALPSRWRKTARTLFRSSLYVFLVWLAVVMIRGLLLPQFLKIDFSFIDALLFYVLYSVPFLLCIFSLTVFIPCGRYLSLPQVEVEERKKVANALTLSTPALGLSWLFAVTVILLLANIQVEPFWIIYIVFISIYVALFLLFIDLPYSVTTREIKKQKSDRLKKERRELLEKLGKIHNGTQKSLLTKIVIESEVARIDREKQEIKSESVHPYKFVIPFASFFLGIFGALFIDFIKNLFQL